MVSNSGEVIIKYERKYNQFFSVFFFGKEKLKRFILTVRIVLDEYLGLLHRMDLIIMVSQYLMDGLSGLLSQKKNFIMNSLILNLNILVILRLEV